MDNFINNCNIIAVGSWTATDEKTGKKALCPLEGSGLRGKYEGYNKYDYLGAKIATGQTNSKVFHVYDDIDGASA